MHGTSFNPSCFDALYRVCPATIVPYLSITIGTLNPNYLIELATYHDEQYGLVVQFLDIENNTKFYALEEINGEKVYTKLDEETNRILEDKYFSMESDLDDE